MKKDVVLVMLAGGVGKRFWPITTDKSLFPFFEKPVISYWLRSIPKEITRIVVVTNDSNREALEKISYPLPVAYVTQKNPNGMAGALVAAEKELGNASLLIVADDVVNPTLMDDVLDNAKSTKSFAVLAAHKPTHYIPSGYLVFDGDRVMDIVEKPGAGNEPSPYSTIVCHFIEDAEVFLAEIKKTKSEQDDVYEKALSRLAKDKSISMALYTGHFATLKYPWQVLDVMDVMLSRVGAHKGRNVEIKKNVVIEGNVYISDNVKIFENTKIVGPCFIGPNTIIGNNNMIRASHIGAGVVTGFNTDITRSYIGDNCWFHANYIGDSVLEGNVSMGSGAVLANLRLDDGEISSAVKTEKIPTKKNKLGAIIGSDVRIGVNTSIMPGVKIGQHSFVGSGVVLDKDVPEDSFCMLVKNGYTVEKNTHTKTASREEFKKKI